MEPTNFGPHSLGTLKTGQQSPRDGTKKGGPTSQVLSQASSTGECDYSKQSGYDSGKGRKKSY